MFFRGVDRAEQCSPDLARGLNLANHFWHEFPGNVAVRTGRSHPGDIVVVAGFLKLPVGVVGHFVAAGAELFSVGGVHGDVEGDHAGHSGYPTDHHQGQHRVAGAWAEKKLKKLFHFAHVLRVPFASLPACQFSYQSLS